MLGVVAQQIPFATTCNRVCKRPSTFNIQQCWKLLADNVAKSYPQALLLSLTEKVEKQAFFFTQKWFDYYLLRHILFLAKASL